MDSLLFYTHHSVGIGHLMRSLSLARALGERFRVTVLCGGKIPDFDCQPPGVETIPLPYLIMAADGTWVAPDGDTARRLLEQRQKAVLEAFERVRPSVIVVEYFPFGRMQYSSEVLALLEAARSSPQRPLVFSSIRDLLERRREHQQIYDDIAAVFCNHLYDGVLVHSDPRLIRFEESFLPSIPVRTPLYYTGYVQPYTVTSGDQSSDEGGPFGIMVSCGGGNGEGGRLLSCALEAYSRHLRPNGIRLHLLAGQFLPQDHWNSLEAAVAEVEGAELRRWIPNLAHALTRATASVSQFGYNTFLDIVRSRVPSLVVPYTTPLDEEQVVRARVLERMGAIRVLHSKELTPERLAQEIDATLQHQSQAVPIDTEGAFRSADIITSLCSGRQPESLVAAADA